MLLFNTLSSLFLTLSFLPRTVPFIVQRLVPALGDYWIGYRRRACPSLKPCTLLSGRSEYDRRICNGESGNAKKTFSASYLLELSTASLAPFLVIAYRVEEVRIIEEPRGNGSRESHDAQTSQGKGICGGRGDPCFGWDPLTATALRLKFEFLSSKRSKQHHLCFLDTPCRWTQSLWPVKTQQKMEMNSN